MSGGDGRVWWRGVQLDARTAAMMDRVAALVGSGVPVHPSQGSWSGAQASAGTHTGCGAVDLTRATAAQCDVIVAEARRVGFAAWHRTPEQADWVRHCHLIAVQPGGKQDRGCLAAAAHRQVIDYYEGRNGLASRAKDDGPRQHVGVTWETYQQQQQPGQDEEDDVVIMFVQYKGDRYVVYPASGRLRKVRDPQMEKDIRYWYGKIGARIIDYPEKGKDVGYLSAYGVLFD